MSSYPFLNQFHHVLQFLTTVENNLQDIDWIFKRMGMDQNHSLYIYMSVYIYILYIYVYIYMYICICICIYISYNYIWMIFGYMIHIHKSQLFWIALESQITQPHQQLRWPGAGAGVAPAARQLWPGEC